MNKTNDELISRLAGDLKAITPPGSPRRQLAVNWALVLVPLTLVAAVQHYRPDLREALSSRRFLSSEALLVVTAVLSAVAATLGAIPGVPRARAWSRLALSFLVTALALGALHVIDGASTEDRKFAQGWECLLFVLGASVVPSALLLVRIRASGAPATPWLTGVLAVLAAATSSAALLGLVCPNSYALHVLFWHMFFPFALLLVTGGLAARKLLRW